jgi:hypothetical protein
MKTQLIAAAASLLMLLSGCLGNLPETPQNVAAAGGAVSLADADRCVHEFIQKHFKDPYSIQDLVIGRPIMGRIGTLPEIVVPFTCNAKNSFGAYIGTRRYYVCVRNGAIDWQRQQTVETISQMAENVANL